MLKRVESRWFRLADLILALTSGLILVFRPGTGFWPIVLALLPWGARLAAGQSPFKRTKFDLLLALFLVTAGVGVWAAYDRQEAWDKFWILASAVLVFYALAGQPSANLGSVAKLLSFLGSLLSIYFLLSYNWELLPVDLGWIERIASGWMTLRPDLPLPPLMPNIVGGILAMLFPIALVPIWQGWQTRHYGELVLFLGSAWVIFIGLFMTSSRGAWLALILATSLWLAWAFSGSLARRIGIPRLRLLAISLFILVAGILLLALSYQGKLLSALNFLPGLPSGGSRIGLDRSTLFLISDYPFTGSGLTSFAGNYSQYIMGIPFFFYAYSHNLYLDLAVEQGVVAALLVIGILVGAGWLLLKSVDTTLPGTLLYWLSVAALTSLAVMLFHGLVDDAVYGMKGTPLLFLLPGLAVALTAELLANTTAGVREPGDLPSVRTTHGLGGWVFLGIVLSFGMVLALFFGKPILSSWYANQGAVDMARMDLAGWPTNKWNSNPDIPAYQPAKMLFERSLALNPEQGTAHHRLGLLAVEDKDFRYGQEHLEKAFRHKPGHHGIKKALGYVYVWNGEANNAAMLLRDIPEADQEMKQYIIWWKQQGRQDLAIKARDMLPLLSSQGAQTENNSVQQ